MNRTSYFLIFYGILLIIIILFFFITQAFDAKKCERFGAEWEYRAHSRYCVNPQGEIRAL